MLRARQRDVGEPQVLAALLVDVLRDMALPLRALEADVDRPRPRRVVERDRRRSLARDPRRLPQVGVVDDRELEPLAAVHGQDLHRLGVALQPAAALLVVVVGGRLQHALAQPRGQRGGAHLLGHRGGVEQLADVAEVGHPPLAVDHREHARGQALLQRDRLHQRRDALLAQHARPVVQAAVDVLPRVVVGLRDALGRPAEEERQRRGARARRVGGALDRLQQPQPLQSRLGAEHAAGAVDDGGDVDGLQRVADARGVAVRPHEHGDVAGADGTLVGRSARAQQRDDVGGDVARDVLPRGLEPRVALLRQADVVARHDPDPQRRRVRRAAQARARVRGNDLPVDDPLVAELRAAEQLVVGVEQPLVAAPVGRQRRLRARRPRRLDVGVDVGAAERVDRLFRVADQHERDAALAERRVHDPPLHGVGVLELVDEHDAVAGAQPGRGHRAALADQRRVQTRQQVVVGHDAGAALAQLELGAGGAGEPHAHGGDRVVGCVGRLDRGGRVVDRRARDLHRLRAAELRPPAAGEAADVEVVDDLVAQVGDVLHERRVGLDVAEHAEAAEHLLAEAVGGGDRRGVEVGERGGEPLAADADLVRRPGGEQLHDLVVLPPACPRGRPRR